MKITISVDGGNPQTFDYVPAVGGSASLPSADPSDVRLVDWQQVHANEGAMYVQYESENLPAGTVIALPIDVSGDVQKTAKLDFGQSGTLGGSFKDCVISDTPGKFDGIVVGQNLNSGGGDIGLNYPAFGKNLTPGRWYINVRVNQPGGVVVTFGSR